MVDQNLIVALLSCKCFPFCFKFLNFDLILFLDFTFSFLISCHVWVYMLMKCIFPLFCVRCHSSDIVERLSWLFYFSLVKNIINHCLMYFSHFHFGSDVCFSYRQWRLVRKTGTGAKLWASYQICRGRTIKKKEKKYSLFLSLILLSWRPSFLPPSPNCSRYCPCKASCSDSLPPSLYSSSDCLGPKAVLSRVPSRFPSSEASLCFRRF